jgi:hypothetical protein
MTFHRQPGPNFKPPKPSRGTAEGLRHMARVKALPCVICCHPPPSDAHHCISGRYGSRKASDFETIPLCKQCHQDGPLAIHQDKAGWQERNGMDHEFLAVVADALAGELNG